MREIENSGKALSVSFIQSFPWGDSHATGTKIMVITNNDNQQADYLAGYLAQKASALADFGMEKPQTLETAIKELPRDFTKPYIWAESADNPGGGGAGDSTHVLRELLAHNISPAAIGYIYDPQNVEKAFQIGVGNRHEFSIGGHFCEFSGEPFVIDAEVISIDYNAFQMFAGTKISLGRAALLRANNLDIIVATIRKQTLGPDLFLRMGVNLAKKRVIVVKSSRHYETEFSYLAERLVTLDTPGVLDLNLARLPYKYFDKSRILNPKSIGRQYPIYTTNFKYTDNMELQEQ
jgi:microcystin degradation protein MlrC